MSQEEDSEATVIANVYRPRSALRRSCPHTNREASQGQTRVSQAFFPLKIHWLCLCKEVMKKSFSRNFKFTLEHLFHPFRTELI